MKRAWFVLVLLIALPALAQQSANCIPDTGDKIEAPPPCVPTYEPPARRRAVSSPETLAPYFPMSGVELTDLNGAYSVAVLVDSPQQAETNPRASGTVLSVVVWRMRGTRLCAIQTITVPNVFAALTVAPLDTSRLRAGDFLVFEGWQAFETVVLVNGFEMFRRVTTAEPELRRTWPGVFSDCTE